MEGRQIDQLIDQLIDQPRQIAILVDLIIVMTSLSLMACMTAMALASQGLSERPEE